jgi:Domain of unknown function (DUF4136)
MQVRTRLAAGAALVVLLAILAACGSTLTVKAGWDEKADFSKYHTWAWKPDGSIEDPVWAKRCQDVLSDQLASDGLKQVKLDQNPDLWAAVHAHFSTKTQVATYSPAWGYGWGAWAPIESYDVQIPVGTILVDLVDVEAKRIVWRGRANDVIQADKTNEEREQKLIAVLKQMFAGFPPAPGSPAPKS